MKIPSPKVIASTLWTHKKKSAVGFVLVGSLVKYLQNRERDRGIFRNYCLKALEYGNQNILAPIVPRRITVLVRDTKARTTFEKHALPLLNLAGLQVDVILPQDAKQLTTIASVLTKTEADAVYIVGNNETVSRVLTGLLQPKPETESPQVGKFRKMDPRNILPPLGIFFDDASNKLRSQCENAMAIIRGATKDANVLQVQAKSNPEPLWIMDGIQYGRFADTEQAVPRYWLWGPLKHRMAYFWKAFGGAPESIEANVHYIEPCSGCSKCYAPPVVQKRHWIMRLLFGQPKNVTPTIDYSKITNESCGTTRSFDLESVELIARNDPNSETPGFEFTYGPSRMGETGFLTEGWSRCKRGDPMKPSENISTTIRAREAEIQFKVAKKEDDAEEEDEEKKPPQMVIGGALIDLSDFTIKTIPKAVQVISASNLKN